MPAQSAVQLSVEQGVMWVASRLTFDNVDEALLDRSRTLLGGRDGPRVVDLSGVAGADSAGLALLIEWVAEARAHGVALEFRSVPDQLRALAEISDVSGLLGLDGR